MYAAVHPHSSTFLRPFAPDPLQALRRSYGRSDSCSRRLGSAGIIVRRPPLRLLREQVSLIHAPGLPTLPSPTTCGCCVSSGHATRRRIGPRLLPHGTPPNGNSGLRHSLQARHVTPAESSFLSYGLAVHLLLLSTPCRHDAVACRLLVYVDPERTSTSLTECALRRTLRKRQLPQSKASRLSDCVEKSGKMRIQ